MRQDDKCIFCKIVRGEIPAIKVYEDDLTVSFMDINPASEGHTLVISKEHFENLLEIEDTALVAVTLSTQHLSRAIQQALNPNGIRISQFNGAAAGQTVFHYHTHIVPIRWGEHPGAHGRGPANPDAVAQVAEKIREALG